MVYHEIMKMPADILCYKHTVTVANHVSFAQCAGFAGASFNETQNLWIDLQLQWASVFSDTLRTVMVMETLCTPHLDESRGELDME